MHAQTIQSQLEAFHKRTQRLERRLTFVTCGWVLTLFMLPLSAWPGRTQDESRQLKSQDVLRVRDLVVVDENGADRIVISARLPDPQIGGKRTERRSQASGIQ